MPTIPTTLALEGLLQYSNNESVAKQPSPPKSCEAAAESPASAVARGPSLQRVLYSPALYATPEPGPIPDVSSIAYSPNIYVANHKRRDRPPRPAVSSRVEGFQSQQEADVLNGGDVIPFSEFSGKGKEEEEKKFVGSVGDVETGDWLPRPAVSSWVEGSESQQEADVLNGGDVIPLSEFSGKGKEEEEEEEKKFIGSVGDVEIVEELNDNFLYPRDSVNVGTSGSDVEDGDSLGHGMLGNQLSVKFRNQDEYYDTAEEFFSDGSFSSTSPSLKRSSENELRLLKVSLTEESSKRKVAEEKFLYLNKQYFRLLKCLSHSTSSSPHSLNPSNLKNEIADPAQICQQFVVVKSVSEALEADLAKAEVEEAFTEIIDAKNHEISRLRDRMMYYEAVNREMSQRNLETVDLARKRRLKRQRMRRWIWSCVGLSVTVGASLLAYSYLPKHGHGGSSAPPSSDDSTGISQ